MATYQDVEKLRKKRHYIKYYDPTDKNVLEIDFTSRDIKPVYTDEFCLNRKKSLDDVCRESQLFKETLDDHDCNKNNNQFKMIEMYLADANLARYSKYVKRIMTINNDIDNSTFYNVANACATIDFAELVADISCADNDTQEIWEIIKALSLEANAAALNGLFARMLSAVRNLGTSKGKYMHANRNIEKTVMNLYNRTMLGDKKNKPIEIQDDASEPWQTVVRLNKQIDGIYKMNPNGELNDKQLIEKIIKPFEQTILTDFSLIDINEFDI